MYTGKQIMSMLKKVLQELCEEGKVLAVAWRPSDRDPSARRAEPTARDSVPPLWLLRRAFGQSAARKGPHPEAESACPSEALFTGRRVTTDTAVANHGGSRGRTRCPGPAAVRHPLLCPLSWADPTGQTQPRPEDTGTYSHSPLGAGARGKMDGDVENVPLSPPKLGLCLQS